MFRRRRAAGDGRHADEAEQTGGRPLSHGHTHGAADPAMLTSERGIWATKVSLVVLLVTAAIQVAIVFFTGSIALLADTIHNFGNASTAIPLWIAFSLSRRRPTRRFTYGLGRVEDLAGLLILVMVLASGVAAGYQSIIHLFDPPEIRFLWVLASASVLGFLSNEGVALFRIKVGRQIGSAALVADGYHARVDGLTSLAVLVGALAVWLGYPMADPVVGLVITAAILWIVWQVGREVFTRLLDGVEPEVIDEVRQISGETARVEEVTDVRVRWLGHRLLAEVNIAVDPALSVETAHDIAQEVHHGLLHHLRYLSNATIHVDPVGRSGEDHHHSPERHQHGDEHHADDETIPHAH